MAVLESVAGLLMMCVVQISRSCRRSRGRWRCWGMGEWAEVRYYCSASFPCRRLRGLRLSVAGSFVFMSSAGPVELALAYEGHWKPERQTAYYDYDGFASIRGNNGVSKMCTYVCTIYPMTNADPSSKSALPSPLPPPSHQIATHQQPPKPRNCEKGFNAE